MISKKILFLLCIGITSLSFCMEDNSSLMKPDLPKKFYRLIKNKQQLEIIDYLEAEKDYTSANLNKILEQISIAKLEKVINYLLEKYKENLSPKDIIESAILAGNIEKVKELTDFATYFDGQTLDKKEYFKNIRSFGLEPFEIMDLIFVYDKVNYSVNEHDRYLQLRIARKGLKH